MVEPLKFTEEQKAAFRAEFAPKATDIQWTLFVEECQRRALIPGTHVIFSLRTQSEYDATLQDWVSVKKVAFMTTINALRLIAKRDGKYEGRNPFKWVYREADNSMKETGIPEGTLPHAVYADFFHVGWKQPIRSVARFDAFAQRSKKGDLTSMWAKRSEEQLAKCCEAAGLREVAPEECGGLYIKEELDAQEETPVAPNVAPAPAAAPPQAIVAPAVNQNPAPEPTADQVTAAMNASIRTGLDLAVQFVKEHEGGAEKADAAIESLKKTYAEQDAKKAASSETKPVESAVTQDEQKPNPENERLPNPNEFGAFTARASKLMRETLPKAGIKAAADAFKAYTARVSGQGKSLNTKKLTVAQWESLLSTVENTPIDQVAVIVKGK